MSAEDRQKPLPFFILLALMVALLFFGLWVDNHEKNRANARNLQTDDDKPILILRGDADGRDLLPGGNGRSSGAVEVEVPPPEDVVAEEEISPYPKTEDFKTSSPLELAMQMEPGELVGWVSDEHLLPIAGARVHLQFEEALKDEQGPKLEAISSDSGLFLIEGVPPGRWTALAEKENYGKDAMAGIEILANMRHEPIDLRLGAEVKVKGTVKAGEQPVKGATIVARRERLSVSQAGDVEHLKVTYSEATSNGKGEFELKNLPVGKILIQVRADGYARQEKEFAITEKMDPIELTLATEALLAGVVKSERGRPVQKAELTLALPKAKAKDEPFAQASSGEDGSFTFRELPALQEFQLRAKAEGYADTGPIPLMSGTGSNIVIMGSGGAIEGTVVNFDSGYPMMGIGVVASHESREISLWTKTNSDGQYRIERLPAGNYHVSIHNERYTSEPRPGVKVEAKKATKGVDFSIYPGITIIGTVADGENGERLAGATVNLESRVGPNYLQNKKTTSTTDKMGSFRFENLPQGIYRLRASLEGYMAGLGEEESVRLDLLRSQIPEPAEIKLYRAGIIDGIVTGLGGGGIEGALVQLFHAPGTPNRINVKPFKATTNASGNFTLEGIPIHHDIHFIASASAEGHAKGKSDMIVLGRRQHIKTAHIELEGGQTVNVRVRDKGGAGISEANVSLSHPDFPGDPPPASWSGKTDGLGVAVFQNIPPGKVRASASKEGFLPNAANVDVGRSDPAAVDIELETSQMLTGRVMDDLREPIRKGRVDARPEPGARGSGASNIGEDSTFKINTLASGTFYLDVTAVRATPTGERKVAWGVAGVSPNAASGEVLVTVPMNGSLTGRVLQPENTQPPAKYTVALAATYRDETGRGRSFAVSHAFDPGSAFTFDNLPPGEFRLTISAPNYLPTTAGPFAVTSPGQTTAGDISMRPGGHVKTRVVDGRTKEAIGGVLVALVPDGPSGRTNANGEVRLSPVNPAIYTMKLSHGEFLPTEQSLVKVTRGRETDVGTLEMMPAAVLFGEVKNLRGQGLGGIKVEARAANSEEVKRGNTDSQGRYNLRGLQPGGQYVTYSGKVNRRDVSRSLEVNVSPEQAVRQDVTLSADSRLHGHLVAPGTINTASSIVNIYPVRANGMPLGAAIKADDVSQNRFVVNDLIEGYYLVAIQAPEGKAQRFWAGGAMVSGDTHVTFKAGTLMLEGKILDRSGGEPVAKQEIRLDLLSAPQSGVAALRKWWQWSARTDKKGNFKFSGLPPGTYSLVAHNEVLQADILEIVTLAEEEPLVVTDLDFDTPAVPQRAQVDKIKAQSQP